jgi:hypothetical protein|tara:strand:- start:657 stop:863 length:207 start_codon:yes stop_codon:yes gene_type:complete
VKEIEVGSLVAFVKKFKSEAIPNIGIVMEIISFDDLLVDDFYEEVIWYSVRFGHVDLAVSSEMIILLN